MVLGVPFSFKPSSSPFYSRPFEKLIETSFLARPISVMALAIRIVFAFNSPNSPTISYTDNSFLLNVFSNFVPVFATRECESRFSFTSFFSLVRPLLLFSLSLCPRSIQFLLTLSFLFLTSRESCNFLPPPPFFFFPFLFILALTLNFFILVLSSTL